MDHPVGQLGVVRALEDWQELVSGLSGYLAEVPRQHLSELFPMEFMSQGAISSVSMGALMQECSMFGIIKEDIQLRLVIET